MISYTRECITIRIRQYFAYPPYTALMLRYLYQYLFEQAFVIESLRYFLTYWPHSTPYLAACNTGTALHQSGG